MNGDEVYTSVRGAGLGTPVGFKHLNTYAFPAPRATAHLSRRDSDSAVFLRIVGGSDRLSSGEAAVLAAEVAARNRIIFRDLRRPAPRVLYASEGRWREVTFESFRASWRTALGGRYRTLEIVSDRAVPAEEYLEITQSGRRCHVK